MVFYPLILKKASMRKALLVTLVSLMGVGVYAQSSSIQPNVGSQGQSLPIIISGQNTQYQAGSATVHLQYSQGSTSISMGSMSGFTNIQVNSSNQISGTLVIPTNAPNGSYDLLVVAGSVTYDQSAFTVQPPTSNMVQMNPNGVQPGNSLSGMTISVPGGSFKNAVSGIQNVWLSRGPVVLEAFSNINVLNSNSFTADLSVAANVPHGMYDINVYENSGAMHVMVEAFEIAPDVSLEDPQILNFSYYPNPAKDYLKVEYSSTNAETVFEILDLNGRLIQSHKAEGEVGEMEFSISDLSNGIYLLRVKKDGRLITTKKWQKN